MGGGTNTQCSKCNDEKEYNLGAGMMFGDLNNLMHSFSRSVQKIIHNLQLKYEFEDTDLSHELFECNHCDTVHSRLNLRIQYNNGAVYKPTYKCYECKGRLKLATKNIESYKCRKCGSYELKENPSGLLYLWD